jgi:GDP-L-fucose synthase
MHLGKCLEENNWDAIRDDLNKRPIEGITEEIGEGEKERKGEKEKGRKEEHEQKILDVLKKYGISSSLPVSPSLPLSLSSSPPLPLASSHHSEVTVELWGTGAPFREFLWSEEMADACIFLMENIDFKDAIRVNSSSIREIRNSHINIGTGKEITIKELAYLIKSRIGFNGEIVFNTSKPDGSMRKLTDPSKLHALGWHHQIEIEEGIERLYHWYLNK